MTPLNWLTTISICFLPIGSCTSPGNAGYPSKLYFPASGGDKQITGTESALYLSFEERDIPSDFSFSESDSSMVLAGEWIEITGQFCGTVLNVHAEPNHTGKRRRVALNISSGYYYPTVTIEQSK